MPKKLETGRFLADYLKKQKKSSHKKMRRFKKLQTIFFTILNTFISVIKLPRIPAYYHKKPAAFAAGNTKIKSEKNLKLNKHLTSFLPPEPSMSVYKLSGLSQKSDCLSLHLVLRLLPVIQTDTYRHQSYQYDAES